MKLSILISLFILLSLAVFAQNENDDKTAIKNVIQKQENAWNKHDWDEFCKYYTDDATLINFIGDFWNSKTAIIDHFKKFNDCCLSPTSLKFEVKTMRFLTTDVVIVYTEETLFADRDYDVPIRHYKKGDTDYKWRIDVFEKKNSEWKVTSTQMTLINPILFPHNTSEKP